MVSAEEARVETMLVVNALILVRPAVVSVSPPVEPPAEPPATGSSVFTESFNTSLVAPWYDELPFETATNPTNGTQAWSFTWLAGAENSNGASTNRRKFTATNEVYMSFTYWSSSGFVGDNHLLHFRDVQAGDYDPSSSAFILMQIKVIDGNLRVNPASADRTLWPEYNQTGGSINDGNQHSIKVYCKLNTVGQADGIVQAWVDDALVLDISNMQIKVDANEQWGQFYFGPYLHSPQAGNQTYYVDDFYLYDSLQGEEPTPSTGWWTSIDAPIQTLYVATTGNDSTGDGAIGTPWKTIAKAASEAVAGDKILVRGGTYFAEDSGVSGGDQTHTGIKLPTGTATNPIWFSSYPGELAIIDQQDAYVGFVSYSGSNYNIIDGFEIKNCWTAGVWNSESTGLSHIVVINNHIHDIDGISGGNTAGIRADDHTGYYIANNKIHAIGGITEDHNCGAVHSYSSYGIVIEYNEFYDCGAGLFHKKPNDSTTLGGDVFAHNYVHNTSKFIYYNDNENNAGRYVDTTVRNNIAHDVTVLFEDAAHQSTTQSTGLAIYNNTFIGNYYVHKSFENTDLYNNIFAETPGRTMYTNYYSSEIDNSVRKIGNFSTIDHNLSYPNFDIELGKNVGAEQVRYQTLSSWQAASTTHRSLAAGFANPGDGSLNSDPLFTNSAIDDYTLQAGSPARSAGRNGEHMGAYSTDETVVGQLSSAIEL